MGRVCVVEASEGVLRHTEGRRPVKVAVPVDLQRHDSTLPSREEEKVSSSAARPAHL